MYGFVKGTGLGYVFYYHVAEFVFWNGLVVVEDCLPFLRGTDGGHDRVSSLEEYVENMGSYEAGTAWERVNRVCVARTKVLYL